MSQECRSAARPETNTRPVLEEGRTIPQGRLKVPCEGASAPAAGVLGVSARGHASSRGPGAAHSVLPSPRACPEALPLLRTLLMTVGLQSRPAGEQARGGVRMAVPSTALLSHVRVHGDGPDLSSKTPVSAGPVRREARSSRGQDAGRGGGRGVLRAEPGALVPGFRVSEENPLHFQGC